jgi:hypothetical protein
MKLGSSSEDLKDLYSEKGDSTWYMRSNEGTDKANPELGLKYPCGQISREI